MKDTIKFEVAQAERATGADVGRALARQARMYDQSRQFFERYEYFVLPVTQVEPFDVDTPYPTEIAGTAMATYIDWMRSCWYVTMMANPAISVPAGFTRQWSAGRPADRRPSSRRLECPAARPCVRAGHTAWKAQAAAALTEPAQLVLRLHGQTHRAHQCQRVAPGDRAGFHPVVERDVVAFEPVLEMHVRGVR